MGLIVAKKPPSDIPECLTRQQCREIIKDTNKMLCCHRERLRVEMRINEFGNYDPKAWHLAKARTTVKPFLKRRSKQKEDEVEKAILEMEQVWRVHKMLKSLGSVEEQFVTPSVANEKDLQRECCICMANMSTVVLPCMHSYCDVCTSQYIIEKDERKCPQCRTQFQGSRLSLERSCYELINEDHSLYDQPRTILLQQIGVRNPHIERWLRGQLEHY